MSVQISTTGTNQRPRRARFPLRFGTGTPFVVWAHDSVTEPFASKGNSVTPTNFTTNLLTGSPGIETFVVLGSNLAGTVRPIVDGMNTIVQLRTVNESGTTNTETIATYDLYVLNDKNTDICIDSNSNYHVVYVDSVANMGTEYTTIYYTNNIGGSWKSPVEVIGASSQTNALNCSIQIDTSNFPIVFYTVSSNGRWARGNAVNASSFNLSSLTTGVSFMRLSLGVDTRGDHYVFGTQNQDLKIEKHEEGAAWGNTLTTITNKRFTQLYGIKLVGDFAYVIHKDTANNNTGISITKIDISGTTPSYVETDENTDDNPYQAYDQNMKTTPLYHNYDSTGTDNGVGTQSEFDICFNVFNAGDSEYEPYWRNYSTAVTTSGSTINIGDSWKEIVGMQINIGDSWKTVVAVKINIGDTWKDVTL